MRVTFLISAIYGLQVHSGLEADANRLARCHGIDMSNLTISTTHALYSENKLTPRQLVECYIARINCLNPTLKAVLEMDPHALEWALSPAGNKPLYGIPVLVKGNIGVKSLRASAGAAALESNMRDDADIVKKLREAGAIILGTSNLSELSGSRSYEAPEGWSQLGGQTLNPYNLNETTLGSSSGSAVAVATDLALVALGTETLGSTIAPASRAMVVGFKPTYNWTSTEGIIPMAPTLDTVGIFTKNVQDATAVFKAITSDETTCPSILPKKVGIIAPLENKDLANKLHSAALYLGSHIQVVERLTFDKEIDFDAVSAVIYTEFKHHINKYLSSNAAVRTLQDIIDFNSNQEDVYPQELLQDGNLSGDITQQLYIANRTKVTTTLREEFEKFMAANELDAMLISSSPLDFDMIIPALSGFPSLTIPAGFDATSTPMGISIFARQTQECLVLALAELLGQGAEFKSTPPQYLFTPTF